MTAREALHNGRLLDAVRIQTNLTNDDPSDAAARLFLAELLTLAGEPARARTVISTIPSDSPQGPPARREFRRMLTAITRRHRRPRILSDPIPEHVRRRWRGVRALRDRDSNSAVAQFDRADAVGPFLSGHVDGREFDGLRDVDDRFASVLELYVGGRYCWLPFEGVRRITIAPAEFVLDAAYRKAVVRFADGVETNCVLPLLYPDSHAADEEFALGRDTDWIDAGGPAVGVGARACLFGDEELPLGDCRQIDFRPAT